MAALTKISGGALGLAVASTLVGIGLAELAVRRVAPCEIHGYVPVGAEKPFFTYHEGLGWRGRPSARGPFRGLDYATEVSLDARGNRSPNPPFVAALRNVVILGDSYGWGWGVADDQVVTHRMMELEPGINTYNLSTPGYGTGQEYISLGVFVDEHPDARIDSVVLLAFPGNDYDDVAARVRHRLAKPRFELAGGKLLLTNVPAPRPDADAFDAPSDERGEPPSWLSHSHLWNTLILRPQVRALHQRIFDAREESAGASARESHKRALVRALIDAIDRRARARGADFAVVVIASNAGDSRANDTSAWLAERGLAHRRFDLDAGWRRRTHCIDGHLSPAGNDQLARETLGLLAAL